MAEKDWYHYEECGLDNVWLINGFDFVDTPYGGKGVVIQNIDGLHQAIAKGLISGKPRLSGKELRFLRHELGLAQRGLGGLLGVDQQTVARWEKDQTVPPAPADRLIRQLYREHEGGNERVTELLQELSELDEIDPEEERRIFEETEAGWRNAA